MLSSKVKETETIGKTDARLKSQADLQQNTQDLNKEKATNTALEHKLTSLTENYRSKLLDYLNEGSGDGLGAEQSKKMVGDLTRLPYS